MSCVHKSPFLDVGGKVSVRDYSKVDFLIPDLCVYPFTGASKLFCLPGRADLFQFLFCLFLYCSRKPFNPQAKLYYSVNVEFSRFSKPFFAFCASEEVSKSINKIQIRSQISLAHCSLGPCPLIRHFGKKF